MNYSHHHALLQICLSVDEILLSACFVMLIGARGCHDKNFWNYRFEKKKKKKVEDSKKIKKRERKVS